MLEYESKHKTSKYFVMKLEDEFNIPDIIGKLSNFYYVKVDYDTAYGKIKGLDLALIILNSITDKSKLK